MAARSVPADSLPAPGTDRPGPSCAVGLYVNFVPDETYLLPTVALTWGRVYAEARYQYEDLDTASLWVGRPFTGGSGLEWWITPLAGVAFGRTDGVAPGLAVDLAWRRFSLSSSAEYLFDLDDSDASFFYSWTEWIVLVHDSFSPGITVERTRVHDTDLALNTGFTLYLSVRSVAFSFYAFNPWDGEDDYYVCGIGGEF